MQWNSADEQKRRNFLGFLWGWLVGKKKVRKNFKDFRYGDAFSHMIMLKIDSVLSSGCFLLFPGMLIVLKPEKDVLLRESKDLVFYE